MVVIQGWIEARSPSPWFGLLAWLCRTKYERRDDPRLLGEFALVVMCDAVRLGAELKHHLRDACLLPYTYIAYRVGVGGLSKTWVRWVLGGDARCSPAS